MLEVIDSGLPLASCYFADNDSIAIGAIKALKLRGLRIPEDIAIVGFDNISESRIIDPSLTTIDVPRLQLGKVAARLLLDQIHSHSTVSLKVELATHLVKRLSHCRP